MAAEVHRQIHIQTASKLATSPVRKYVPKVFELEGFGKLSAASIQAHLDLYQGYVVQTNAVLDSLARLERAGGELVEDPARPAESLARRLSFELNGIVLHELFFEQYLHGTSGSTGSFERAACFNFGSFEQWQASVRAVARTREIGWVVTVFDEQRSFLHNVWVGSHDLHVPANHRVVFVLDLWEHAYLGDYGVKGREEYVDAALGEVCRECLDLRIDKATGT
jgi:Fe-Mn family superoxide dismutase